MNPSQLATFKRALQTLRFEGKTHLTRQEIDRLVQELTLNRDYDLADYISSLDPATINALLR
jgi:hypothetical protein